MAAATPKAIKGTSITQPTADPKNHQIVLNQLKETTEIAQRQRGDPQDSFVRVSEFSNVTGAQLINGTIQPVASTSSSSGTVSVTDSITGTGAAGSPLQLSGDSASPGNNMAYQTNGSGVKGWYSASGGSYTPPVTTKGDLFGYSTTPARIPVGADGQVLTADSTQALGVKWAASGSPSTPLPGTIPDLVVWIRGDLLTNNTNGIPIPILQNSAPSQAALTAYTGCTGGTVASTTLNSLPVLACSSSASGYVIPGNGIIYKQFTCFYVFKATSFADYADFCSGQNYSLQFLLTQTGGYPTLYVSGIAVIGGSSTPVAVGTWTQGNATYNDSTGAYAFRVARAAAGSGTYGSTGNITAPSPDYLFNTVSGGTQFCYGSLAELIIYNRVLTSTEITNIETYLNTKWGV